MRIARLLHSIGAGAAAGAGTGAATAAADLGLIGGTATNSDYVGLALAAGYVRLAGGAGADTLRGTTNDDYLTGGLGSDLLVGGGGTDTVVEQRDDADMTLVDGAVAGNATLTIMSPTTGTEVDQLEGILAVDLTGGASAQTLDVSSFSWAR